MTILWLDDRRDPSTHFKPTPEHLKSRSWQRNIGFYKGILEKYNPKFVWVKTFDEFVNYITKNGLPDMVSLDHDLGQDKNGADCAEWLFNYCKKNGFALPKMYAHTANNKRRGNIEQFFNSALNESVDEYVDGTHVSPSGNIEKFSLDYLGQGEKTGKDGKAGGLQHTDGIYISINPVGNAKFHKTYGSKEVVRRDDVDELGRGGYKVYTYYLQIPDLSRDTYLFEYEPISKYPHFIKAINDELKNLFGDEAGLFLNNDGTIGYSTGGAVKTINKEPFIKSSTLTCANFYRLLKEIFFEKDGKKTSEFLAKCGIAGLIYHGHQDALCAVIYNPDVIKIVDKKVYDVKRGFSGDDIKKDYIATTDYAERVDKFNREHGEEAAAREKFKGHIANKPKNFIAGKKYDSEMNFPYPVDGAFKTDKSHNNLSEGQAVIKINEADIYGMIEEAVRRILGDNLM